ncbi:MAG: PAS domain-containing protein [Bacteroidia bacterium]
MDWDRHALGNPGSWPLSLKNTLAMMLSSRFPICLWWGDAHFQFYNDAFLYNIAAAGKHPAIGKPGRETWSENWDIVGPTLEKVRKGETVWMENRNFPLLDCGSEKEVFWTFSSSPVYNDAGAIEGVIVLCNETTQVVTTQRTLSQSENRFQSLIREAAIGIIVLEGEESLVEIANTAYLALIGREEHEVVGRPLFEIIPEAIPYFKDIIDRTRTSGKPHYLTEHPYFVLQGSSKIEGYLNLIYQPHSKDAVGTTGVMILCHDVTQEVLARRKVAESEAQVRAIINSAPFPIGVYEGREMRIALANESIMEVWGKGDQVVGHTYFDVLPELENQSIYPELLKVYDTGIPFHARNQEVELMIGGQLEKFYFNYSFTPLHDATGAIYGVMNTAADITDLIRAKLKVEQGQENFRNLILQAPIAMCLLLGLEHHVEVANDTMINLWGKSKQDVMHLPIFEALPDARAQGLEEIMFDVYQSGETFTASEMPVHLLRFGKPDVVYQNFVYEPYRDGSGNILGVIAISNNVTEQVVARQRIEELVQERTRELEIANADLKKSNDDLAQFAYIASHDLQEPLRKISVFCQMITTRIAENLDVKSAELLSKINGAAARMQALVQDVLAYSQLSSGERVFRQVDLNAVVKGIAVDFELRIEQLGAELIFGNLPTIPAHALQMNQLFNNLISNALKFTRPDAAPVIEIWAETPEPHEIGMPSEAAREVVKILIRDNGIGFPPEFADKIFTIFQRLHSKSEYEGTGIGLAICKKIILNHNGAMYAQATPGTGALFTILLPLRQD